MTFKEQQTVDLSVFFNADEFAGEHILDGVPMAVIIDDDRLEDIKAKSQYADAIYNAEKLMFVRQDEWGIIPVVGQFVDLDGDVYRVMSVKGSAVLEVILGATR